MAPIRILIVDDSVVIRKLLCDTLSEDPALKVVGSASDGRIALAKIPLLNPDLITLDIEMPVMDGLETLAAVRKPYPELPVIMFSTVTERGAAATLDALSLGASDYATKPSNTSSTAAAADYIRSDVIPKIKALCAGAAPKPATLPAPVPTPRVRPRPSQRIEIVAIGTSTAARTRSPKCCREFRRISPCRSSSSSTCRPFSLACWRSGSQGAPRSAFKKEAGTPFFVQDMRGSPREGFT